MSRTGQYIRHPWTHRSEFQKTKEYGTINFDDCTASDAEAIASNSDDELSDSGRASKRRRIERLAEGYLKGERLFISTARPCPQALQRSIVWHKKGSTEPAIAPPEFHPESEPTQIWRDVKDDNEILKRLVRSSRPRQKPRETDEPLTWSEATDAEPHEDVKIQARFKPQRQLRVSSLDAGPSQGALRQAAALRDRKARKGTAELAGITEEGTDLASPQSDASGCIDVAQSSLVLRSRHDNLHWMSRRKSRFSFEAVDLQDDDVAASSPCIAPSSPPFHVPQTHGTSSTVVTFGTDAQQHDGDGNCSPHKPSYHTAPEQAGDYVEPIEAARSGRLESQQRPSKGKKMSTSLRDYRTSTNDNSSGGLQERSAVPAGLFEASSMQIHHQDKVVQEPVKARSLLGGGFANRCGSSAGRSSNKETQSAPGPRSLATRKQIRRNYVHAPSTQNGTTPLMYRKRSTHEKAGEDQQETVSPPITRQSTRWRVNHLSSEDVQASETQHKAIQTFATDPPRLDMSFEPDLSFAPKLNMALVDEHKNALLPIEPASVGQTSSVKKALRRELKESGAEITRCGSEPPTSCLEQNVQPTESRQIDITNDLGHTGLNPPQSERRQTWLGTQAMVARAERDLFNSPEKAHGAFTPINERTARLDHRRATEPTPGSQAQGSLRPLSQEPAPSTQAILETFGGFSTMKKPRVAAVLQGSSEQTTTALEKGKRPVSASAAQPKGLSSSVDAIPTARAESHRGSSLRFSISSIDPIDGEVEKHGDAPPPDEEVEITAGPWTASLATPASSASGQKTTLRSSNLRSGGGGASQFAASLQRTAFSHSATEDFPALEYEAAQAPEVPFGPLRDPSNMSQAIDDLSRDVLGMTELDGVLSQG